MYCSGLLGIGQSWNLPGPLGFQLTDQARQAPIQVFGFFGEPGVLDAKGDDRIGFAGIRQDGQGGSDPCRLAR